MSATPGTTTRTALTTRGRTGSTHLSMAPKTLRTTLVVGDDQAHPGAARAGDQRRGGRHADELGP